MLHAKFLKVNCTQHKISDKITFTKYQRGNDGYTVLKRNFVHRYAAAKS